MLLIRGGHCPPLYIRGGRVTWKVLAGYSWSPTTTQSGSFLYTAASSMPIRVVTKEVRYIHGLSLTLEHFMPISSPAAPGLTMGATNSRTPHGVGPELFIYMGCDEQSHSIWSRPQA